MKRKFEQAGFTVIVERQIDEEPNVETPEEQQENYEGCTDSEKAEYLRKDTRLYNVETGITWASAYLFASRLLVIGRMAD